MPCLHPQQLSSQPIARSHTCTNSTNSQETHVHANDDADHNTTATRANTT